MWFDVYTQGILIGLVASIPLGPIGLLCIQRTLSKSHRSGFVSGLGAATADSMFATVALFSLTVVMSFIENNMAIIKALGGISVVIVGVTIFLKNPVVQIRRNRAGKGHNLWGDYLSVFFLTLTNPAYILILRRAFRRAGNQPRGHSARRRHVDDPRRAMRSLAVVVHADFRRQLPAAQVPAAPPAVDEPHLGQRDRRAGSRRHIVHFLSYARSP